MASASIFDRVGVVVWGTCAESDTLTSGSSNRASPHLLYRHGYLMEDICVEFVRG